MLKVLDALSQLPDVSLTYLKENFNRSLDKGVAYLNNVTDNFCLIESICPANYSCDRQQKVCVYEYVNSECCDVTTSTVYDRSGELLSITISNQEDSGMKVSSIIAISLSVSTAVVIIVSVVVVFVLHKHKHRNKVGTLLEDGS
ncbi:uncharacterized protein LOC131943683 [Physella acuta]|uniref:uncharacterized protein LOC131943683 n=1 Tax=Physella acuta TaxID=109671 RepID=UPI0027DB9C24|nr:uncharacterized protein LOC131943683 [Physella acuta]